MLMFNETGFGYIVVNSKRYDHDIVVYPDGSVEARLKNLSSKYKSMYGHTPLSKEEIEYYLSRIDPGKLEYIVIALGQYGDLPLTPEAKKVLEDLSKHGVHVVMVKTPKALSILNRLYREGRKVLSIIHVTC